MSSVSTCSSLPSSLSSSSSSHFFVSSSLSSSLFLQLLLLFPLLLFHFLQIIIIITNFASMCFLLLFKYKYPTFNFLVRCVSVIIILISSSSNNYRRNKEFQSLIHNYISSKPSQIRYTSHNLFQGQAILLNLYTIFTSHRYSSMIVICKETTMGTLFKGNNDM